MQKKLHSTRRKEDDILNPYQHVTVHGRAPHPVPVGEQH